MWLNNTKTPFEESDSDSDSSTEEIPIWVRGEQRWVSGIVSDTTCQEVIKVLLEDEESRGRNIGSTEDYHITERWRGVEQPLDQHSAILNIWNAWGTAQKEVKISLRKMRNEKSGIRRTRCKSDASNWSDKAAWKTIHPKRLCAMQNEKQPSNTEELLKLVLAQGEVIRKQLKKLRHSEHQIGCLEDKTHRARVRKHGSNYLLETYLKGLSEALEPDDNGNIASDKHADKNSDSGVVTEGDSEQSNTNKQKSSEASFERFSPSSEEFPPPVKDDDSSSTVSETALKEQADLIRKISKINKQLLKQEEALVRLDMNLKKYEKHKSKSDEVEKSLTSLKTHMAKSSCEMQHNEVVLEETSEVLCRRRLFLESLHRDLAREDEESEMLHALLYSANHSKPTSNAYMPRHANCNTKELLDTLV